MNTGYSNKPLISKLGIKANTTAYFHNCPFGIKAKIAHPQPIYSEQAVLATPTQFILCFVTRVNELKQLFPMFLTHLDHSGMIWIAWPKRESKMPTDLNENLIREIGLANNVVDVKVIAIDETWSGLKFVFRLTDRK
jgi:hypothetical protein